KLPMEHLTSLSLLFGGVGDARHVYTTICDSHKQWQSLDSAKKNAFRIRMVLNDINATVLARDALVIAALIRLSKCAPSVEACEDRGSEAFRLATLLEYTFWGYTMPKVVYDHQMRLIDALVEEDFASLKPVLIADENIWSQIKRIMICWRKTEEGKNLFPTTHKVTKEIFQAIRDDEITSYREGTKEFDKFREIKSQRKRENVQRKENFMKSIENVTIDNFPKLAEELRRSQPPSKRTNEHILKALKANLLKKYSKMEPDDFADLDSGRTSEGRTLDQAFIKQVNAILPPRGCCGTLFDSIWEADEQGPEIRDQHIKNAKGETESQWKVNRTMFDPDWTTFQGGHFDPNIYNPISIIGGDFLVWHTGILDCFVGEEAADPTSLTFFQCSTLFFWNEASKRIFWAGCKVPSYFFVKHSRLHRDAICAHRDTSASLRAVQMRVNFYPDERSVE
ncbi:MAG: hypothetical protein SGILL_001750, partial [Bacillariaceae sp.]